MVEMHDMINRIIKTFPAGRLSQFAPKILLIFDHSTSSNRITDVMDVWTYEIYRFGIIDKTIIIANKGKEIVSSSLSSVSEWRNCSSSMFCHFFKKNLNDPEDQDFKSNITVEHHVQKCLVHLDHEKVLNGVGVYHATQGISKMILINGQVETKQLINLSTK
ncbi:hypothetical protein Glove_21g50 [Diversispora epigaea]|uniref:Uncharacterized protein n=1 Tax=Diversispora epigaea TaxID=1348612 RepID=A0A397JPI7_9GLOM|nr:hypothetical protein Glove_21g50 [Diversispora epigaea]